MEFFTKRHTLARYIAWRHAKAVMSVFVGVVVLMVLLDYVEMSRRTADLPNAAAWFVAQVSLYRVPQATERFLPFAVLVGTMICFLTLSRRLELVIARAAGMSAWQFIAPAAIIALLIGFAATTLYNPIAAAARERSKRMEAQLFGDTGADLQRAGGNFWIRQRTKDGQSIVNAISSREQGMQLDGVTIFNFDPSGKFLERVEAKSARLDSGYWKLEKARIYAPGAAPQEHESALLATPLTGEEVRENFATPETVSFWELPSYISLADRAGLAAAGYKLQYHVLIARPFYLSAMVLLAASVSLHFFRFGGASRTVLSGVVAGFLLYVLSKVTEDLSKAELLFPAAAAWMPVFAGGLTGFVTLLFQEDG